MAQKRKRAKPTRGSRKPSGGARIVAIAAVPTAHNELLLVDEVSARARLSRWTLWRLAKAGRFPSPKQIGFKRIAWRAADVDAWIDGTWVAPQTAAA